MLTFFCHCESRELFLKGMSETMLPFPDPKTGKMLMLPLIAVKDGQITILPTAPFIPTPHIEIDEIGPIQKYYDEEVEVDVQYDQPDGEKPIFVKRKELRRMQGPLIAGHHVNFRCFGVIEKLLTDGLPQTDKAGNPLPLFERTRILSLIPGIKFEAISRKGEPQGYQGPNGVRLYDPATVNHPAQVFG